MDVGISFQGEDVDVAENLADGEIGAAALVNGAPQTARIWNYLLGGTDNFAVDRAVGDQITASMPHLGEYARLSRKYLARAVRWLAVDGGVRQFLDVGTGLPTADNTHQVAQAVAPDSRIVYVDNDPLVLTHAQALLTSSPDGATAYLEADLHDPAAILDRAAQTLDFDRPVALMLMGILGHVESDAEVRSIVGRLMAAFPSGSYVAMYDGGDTEPEVVEATRIWNVSANPKYHLRSPARIAGLFEEFDLVDPGVVSVTRWKPDAEALRQPDIPQFAAMARKP